ncbi:hypothetical protein HJG60_010112 [Phyllostomus discolor]|uniref:Uncharacterized protein n=1 Tax=Phyllostomus discolor TaxID=89673 RepID=A0A834AW67_9CHIR|nr:hypothetical protein HJG60_010112 [Phyllostomus discolor]
MQNSGNTNPGLEKIPHTLRPEEGSTSVSCSEISKVCVLQREEGQARALPARGSAHTTTCQRFVISPVGTHALSTVGKEHCPHQTGRLLVWRQPALGTERGSRGPSRSPQRKRERRLLWEDSVQDLCTFHRCSPSPRSAHPRGLPHRNSCTSFHRCIFQTTHQSTEEIAGNW